MLKRPGRVRIPRHYRPDELLGAIGALAFNTYNTMTESEARAYIKALHLQGWRIVHVGKVGDDD